MKETKQKTTKQKKSIKIDLQGLEGFEHVELSRLCIGPGDSLSAIKLK